MNATTEFAISQEQRGALPLLHVRGDVDIGIAPRLKEAILAVLTLDAQSLAIDFSEVEFLDSTGLEVLFSAKRRIAERGAGQFTS